MDWKNELNSIKLKMLDEFYGETKQIFRKYFNGNFTIDNVKYQINRYYESWHTFRLDIRNKGKKLNSIRSLDDGDYLTIKYPKWFDNGKSCIVQSNENILNLNFECIGNGKFTLYLKGIDFRNINKERTPVYINYTKLKYNDELIFDEPIIAWHNDSYIYKGSCKDKEILNFELEFETIFDYFPQLIEFKNTLIQKTDTPDEITNLYNDFEDYIFQEKYNLWKVENYEKLMYNEQVQLTKKIDEMQSEILTLKSDLDTQTESTHEFLSTLFLDCEIKPTGHLKLVQDLSQEFLNFMVNVFDKYELQYCLTGGVLLGAVRHQGYVPWDDDVDIRMMRCDLKKFLKIINFELKNNNLDKYVYIKVDRIYKGVLLNFVQIFYSSKHLLTNIDIFPFDFIKELNDGTENIFLEERRKFKKDIRSGISRASAEAHYFKNLNISHRPQEHIISGVDGPNRFLLYKTEDIFPLKKYCFNDTLYYGPNNPDKYLTTAYGDYKDIPDSIRNHRKRINNLKADENSKKLLEYHIKKLKNINKNFK